MLLVVLCAASAALAPSPAQPAEAQPGGLDALVDELLAAPDEPARRWLLDAHAEAEPGEVARLVLARAVQSARHGQFAAAEEANAIASEMAVKLKDLVLEAWCAQNAAAICHRRQDFPRAVVEAEKALLVLERLRDTDGAAGGTVEAAVRVCLGHALHGLCRYDAALAQFEQVRDMARGADLPLREADGLVGIGNVRHATGQYDGAMQAYREALGIYRGHWSPSEGGPASLDRLLTAVSASVTAPGLAHPMAACFNNVGVVYCELGRHKDALEYLAPALLVHTVVQDRPEQARTLNNAGSAYLALGRDEQAQERFEAALEIALEAVLPAEAARAWINLGNIDSSRGRLDEASERFNRAAAFLERAGDRSGQAAALNNIGSLLARQGRHAEALAQYERVLAIAREIGTRASEAVALHNAGCVRLEQARKGQQAGALDQAWLSFSEARKTAAAIGDRETLWRAAYGEGLTLELQGDGSAAPRQREQWQAARDAYEAGIEAVEAMRFGLRETEFGEGFLGVDDRYRVYEDLVALLGKLGEPEAAVQYLQRARYAALAERLRLSAISTGDEALDALLARYESLMRQREKIELVLGKELGEASARRSPEREENLTELKRTSDAEVHRVWTALNQIAPEIGAIARPSPARWVMSPALLPAGAVLVQYLPTESQLLIFTTRRGGRPAFVSVGVGRAELNARVQRVRELMQDADADQGRQGVAVGRELRDALVRLHADLIQPIQADLARSEVLVVLPYGMLYYLPFSALARETGPGEVTFLIEEIPIAYLNELTTDGLGEAASAALDAPSRLAAFADPDGSLPSADREVRRIAGLLPRTRREVHMGEDATRAAALNLSGDTGVVHFATHGVLNRQDLNESYLVLADGRLRQGEVYGLRLREKRTRLAVLSACETFPGQEQPGVEVLGLADAFIKSGAEAVLSSLWAVRTESTAELMVGFYEPLVKERGISRSEALRRAQLGLLRDPRYAHPYFWSPFVLYGDWR